MKNTLLDLNNYLFEQIERIMDDSLTDEEFQREEAKSKIVCQLATTAIASQNLIYRVCTSAEETGYRSAINALHIEEK